MLFSTLFVLIGGLFYTVYLIRNIRKKQPPMRIFILTLFFLYVVAVVSVVYFPFPYQANLLHDLRIDGQPQNNIIPLRDIRIMFIHDTKLDFLKQVGGNIVMFFPFGFLLPLIRIRIQFSYALLAGTLASLLIEVTQLILDKIINYNYRVADIDDLICNVIGFVIGYVAFKSLDAVLDLTGLVKSTPTNTPTRVEELRH